MVFFGIVVGIWTIIHREHESSQTAGLP